MPHITILRFPTAEAAAKSRGEGKSPKPVSSDHCHISGTYYSFHVSACQKNSISPKHVSKFPQNMNSAKTAQNAIHTSIQNPKVPQPVKFKHREI